MSDPKKRQDYEDFLRLELYNTKESESRTPSFSGLSCTEPVFYVCLVPALYLGPWLSPLGQEKQQLLAWKPTRRVNDSLSIKYFTKLFP